MSGADFALLERAVVEAAEKWRFASLDEPSIYHCESLEPYRAASKRRGEADTALGGAVDRLIKARSEDTRR